MAPTVVAADELEAALRRARVSGLERACRVAERGRRLPRGILLAVASRETGCRNVVGDGGHGRGAFQIDDRFHFDWLARHGAGKPGTVPPLAPAAAYAASLLAADQAFARRNGIPSRARLKFMLSAYNAGSLGALRGYRRGDSDLATTGRNYGADVAERLGLVRRWLSLHPVEQFPPLPARVSFPAALYPRGRGWLGLQPWIVPQVRAVADRFGLTPTTGWATGPPHARRSDHAWGGACDLTGPRRRLVACNRWADRYRADPYRPGMVFRWVGGPASDANGPEPGHPTHVHLSWYRLGPATSVFDTSEFRPRLP
jgi:hypothetical protein